MSVASRWQWIYQEFGIESVYKTGLNAWLIILSRSCRMFAYGAASVFIALFFSALNFSDFRIGLFMTLTLVGDVVLTIVLTWIADSYGRRKVLLLGSGMMILSGLVFSYFENFWILLFAAVVGIISASGGDFGPFRAIEESILSQLTGSNKESKDRNDVLSWYVTTASLGSAIGSEASGRGVLWLENLKGWNRVEAYHAVFGLYVVFGTINAICCLCMTKDIEAGDGGPTKGESVESAAGEEEERILLQSMEGHDEDGPEQKVLSTTKPSTTLSLPAPRPPTSISKNPFSSLSPSTLSVMFKLWPLLIVDTLADGMVNQSLTMYFISNKFSTKASTLGDIASTAFFLSAISTVFAGPLANRFGLINTMVFTHIPSSAAVLFFALPSSLWMTIVLFFIRVGLNNMDQAPRAAFIAAVVPANERTAVNGLTSTFRTLSSTFGPTITGSLAEQDKFWIAFVAAGSMRLAYDFGLWALFINMNLNKEES